MSMPWFRTRRHDDRHARRQARSPTPIPGRVPRGPTDALHLVVTTTADSGNGSLRQAIVAADANTSSTPTTIDFDIPGAYLHTISLDSPLPSITDPVIIDGTTSRVTIRRP